MEAYEGFAEVYDLFMDNIPYKDWSDYVSGILKEYGIEDGLILDLGCGTGSLTELLAERGYDMIGVDHSEDMLQIAMDKRAESGNDILYLMQDMREFELYGTVRAVISICDCMNYILEQKDLTQVFKLVNNYLDPGGIFIFDLNTVFKYENLMGESTIAEDREDCSFIWDNFYDKESGINEYGLSLFIKQEDDLYRKHTECHYQRAYTIDEIKQSIKDSGMEFVAAYDAFTREPVKESSERIYFIVREHGKEL
jgi:SAM-dependent methyltransferase